jgi:hypothetical protein
MKPSPHIIMRLKPPGPLRRAHHERFAQLIVSGLSQADAYREIKGDRTGARTMGAKWAARVDVRARIAELLEKTKARALLTNHDRRMLMSKIANDPDERAETRMRAAMNDAALAGELIEKADLTSNGEALPSALPPVTLNVPPVFVTRRGGVMEGASSASSS